MDKPMTITVGDIYPDIVGDNKIRAKVSFSLKGVAQGETMVWIEPSDSVAEIKQSAINAARVCFEKILAAPAAEITWD